MSSDTDPENTDLITPAPAEGEGGNPEFNQAVSELVETIRSGSSTIREATAAATPKEEVVEAPIAEPLTIERLNELADPEQGGSVGKALQEVGEKVLAPMYGKQFDTAKRLQRKLVEQNVELGEFARAHRKEVDEYITSRGVTDQVLADDGYEEHVKELMDRDPTLREARDKVKLEEAVATRLKELGYDPEVIPTVVTPVQTSAPRPTDRPVARPSVGPGPVLLTEAQQIARVQVSEKEAKEAKDVWGMTVADVQKQRFERLKLEDELGEMGLRNVGGLPVCTLEEIGLKPVTK